MKGRTILAWILIIIIAAMYAMAALGKLTGAATDMFAGWGYPAWFALMIGILEGLGAIGLIIPATTRWAVYGLTILMIGAGYTHLANNEGLDVLRPVIFTTILWAILFLRGELEVPLPSKHEVDV